MLSTRLTDNTGAMALDPHAALSKSEHALVRLAFAVRELGYHFITPTPATHERVNARPGNIWAEDLRGVLGWSRPFKTGLLPPQVFELMRDADMLEPSGDGWRSRLRLSSLNGLLCWHTAHPTTDPDAVFFGPDTYRFAQSIGQYLEKREMPLQRAMDMGCGTGAGALRVALAWPEAEIWAGDINIQALRLAGVNAAIAGTRNVRTCQSNMLSGVDGDFDLVVANPPYLNDSLKRSYRHGGGSHGQDLAVAMLRAALPRLRTGGTMLLYTGSTIVDGRDTFLDDAQQVLAGLPTSWRWSYREMDPDVFGEELINPAYDDAERIAAVVLQATAS
ncbi:methyltransferase [Pusillimonas sp.]|uniref:methyltransferase n=1 Tax=Pusillimonas sp. TaxID=3040095 RepID=UPI0037CA5D41